MKKLFLLLLIVALMAACGQTGPDIQIEDAWVRPTPLMENAAGYLLIRNDGNEPDALIGARVEFVKMATIHEMVMEGDVHSMQEVPRLEIPAKGQVELRPLSYHVMMMGLTETLEVGQTVTYVLEFEKSGELTVEAEVRQE